MLDDNDKQWIRNELDNVIKHVLAEIGRRQEENEAKFASSNSRLTLHAGLLQSGSRAINRVTAYSENSEARWLDLDKRVRVLESRMGPKPEGAA